MSYIPGRGDVVWLTFDPQAGHEQACGEWETTLFDGQDGGDDKPDADRENGEVDQQHEPAVENTHWKFLAG